MGFMLPATADLVLVSHFTPTGKPESVQLKVGLHLCRRKPARTQFMVDLGPRSPTYLAADSPAADAQGDGIPAGVKSHTVTFTDVIPVDADLLNIFPHAHLLCRDIKVLAVRPDGSLVPLIWIRDWDFSMQRHYVYRTPIRLPRGSRIVMQYTYDNSADNPRNPSHPPRIVPWGETTNDEMMDCYIQLSPTSDAGVAELQRTLAERQRMSVERTYQREPPKNRN